MRVRTTVAAGVLAAVVSFPLAGVAQADVEDCPFSGASAAPDAELAADARSAPDAGSCDDSAAPLPGGGLLGGDPLGGGLPGGDPLAGGLFAGNSSGGDMTEKPDTEKPDTEKPGIGEHGPEKPWDSGYGAEAEGTDGTEACEPDKVTVCEPDKAGTPEAQNHRTDGYVPPPGDTDRGKAPVGGVEAGAGGAG